MDIREEYKGLHQFIFQEKAEVISGFYKGQEVVIDFVSMEIPEQIEEDIKLEALPKEYQCIITTDNGKIGRSIDAKDLKLID